jgi:hypothetical protein
MLLLFFFLGLEFGIRLFELFGQVALAVTMKFWSVFVFAVSCGDIRFVELVMNLPD